MLHVHLSYTARTPHPASAWTLYHEQTLRFNDMAAVKDFLRRQYLYCKKRVPCYQDTKSRGTIQTGWIYCYKDREDCKTYYRQDWVSVGNVEYAAVDVRHTA